jgi:hypothetical protein
MPLTLLWHPQAVEKVLAGAIRREMALEEICAKQNSEIMHLNRLVGLLSMLTILQILCNCVKQSYSFDLFRP